MSCRCTVLDILKFHSGWCESFTMSFYVKSLKRETTNFIARNLDNYPVTYLQDLPDSLKTDLLEQIIRIKTHFHLLKTEQCCHTCQCQYCKSVETLPTASHLKRQMTALINPQVSRLLWTLEYVESDLEFLAKCKGLRSLNLYIQKELQSLSPSHGNIKCFSQVFPMLPHLTELKLLNADRKNSDLITDKVVFTLCKSCPLLFSLSLENCACLTDACMEALSQLRIRHLNLSNSNFTDTAFVNIRQTSPLFETLCELKLQDCLFLTNAIVKCFLIRCESLTLLNCLGSPRLNNFDLLFSSNAKLQIYFTFDF